MTDDMARGNSDVTKRIGTERNHDHTQDATRDGDMGGCACESGGCACESTGSASEPIGCACGAHTHSEPGETRERIVTLALGAVLLFGALLMDRAGVNRYAVLGVYVIGYLVLGGKIVLRAAKDIARGKLFDENFLMTLASLGAFAIGEYPEAVAVMLFYQVGEAFQDMAVNKSRRSIESLLDIRPDFANVEIDGELVRTPPDEVNVNDTIVIKPGERVPLDGVVLSGEAMLDTSALTGESMPARVLVGDAVLSGCICQNGMLTVRVTKPAGESTAAKIIEMVENAASQKAPTEQFITRFSRYYTPVVVLLAALIALLPPLIMGGWADWIGRALVFLVISCPCALVVSIPLGFFGGIGGASRSGVLVKGGNYLEALAQVDIVVFDKTGTLTKGVFEVSEVRPASGLTRAALIETAAYAEAASGHPIALSIARAYEGRIDRTRITEARETPGRGVSVMMDGKLVLAGNAQFMSESGVAFERVSAMGSQVYVAVDGVYAGVIIITDQLKPDSHSAIMELKKRGVRRTVMLTGDNAQTGEAVARELQIDEVYAGLLPDQKLSRLEQLIASKRRGGKLAYVGDGINDAPVLARADVGVAMGALGSDAAIEAADVVLMTDEPMKLVQAIDIARFTRRIVFQNIVLALAVKGLFLLLGVLGFATMWEAVFADVGVALLAILNAMRAMRRKS